MALGQHEDAGTLASGVGPGVTVTSQRQIRTHPSCSSTWDVDVGPLAPLCQPHFCSVVAGSAARVGLSCDPCTKTHALSPFLPFSVLCPLWFLSFYLPSSFVSPKIRAPWRRRMDGQTDGEQGWRRADMRALRPHRLVLQTGFRRPISLPPSVLVPCLDLNTRPPSLGFLGWPR